MTKKEESLARREAAAPPEFIRRDLARPGERPRGLEDLEQADLVMPRLAVCQAMSPQRQKTNEALYIDGLEEGQLFNTVSRRIYGGGPLQLVPLFFFKSRLFFRDMKEGGGLLCQSFNAKDGGILSPTCDTCPNSRWGQEGEKPPCQLLHNYVCLTLPDFDLVVVSMKSTALKAAKQWNSLMRLRNTDTFAGIYQLMVVKQTNKFGTFFNYAVQPAGWVDEPTYRRAEALFNDLRGKRISPHGLEAEPDAAEPAVEAEM